jgi:hypothetical protein
MLTRCDSSPEVADILYTRMKLRNTALPTISKPPNPKRQLSISPRKANPRIEVNTTSLVKKRPPPQLLQYLNPWFIRSWAIVDVKTMPPIINHSIPERGSWGLADKSWKRY